MKKNFLLLLLMTLLPFAGRAEENPTTFEDLQTAITQAQSGSTITLGASIAWYDETPKWELDLDGKTLTIDMNRHQMTGRLNFRNGNLTIANGLFTNEVPEGSDGYASQPLNVYGSADPVENYSVLTIAADAEVQADYDAVCLFGTALRTNGYGAVINIYGTVTTFNYAQKTTEGAVFVSGNLGNSGEEDDIAIMTASNVINIYENAGVNAPYSLPAFVINGAATLNVYGGEIYGGTGVCMKRGTLNVEDGKIITNGYLVHPTATTNNGAEPGGDVITISPTYAAHGQITVNISGGQFYSDEASGIFQSVNPTVQQNYRNTPIFNITGGTFINRQSAFDWEYYGNEGFNSGIKLIDVTESDPAKFITGGVYTEDPSAYIPEGYMVIEEEIDVPEYAAILLYPSNAPIRRASQYRPTIAYRVVEASDYYSDFDWEMEPESWIYDGAAKTPFVEVFDAEYNSVATNEMSEVYVKEFSGFVLRYFTDEACQNEVSEMKYVNRDSYDADPLPYYVQLWTVDGEDQDGNPTYGYQIGDTKEFLIEPNTFTITLAKTKMQYGDYLVDDEGEVLLDEDGEPLPAYPAPKYTLSGYQGTDNVNNTKVIGMPAHVEPLFDYSSGGFDYIAAGQNYRYTIPIEGIYVETTVGMGANKQKYYNYEYFVNVIAGDAMMEVGKGKVYLTVNEDDAYKIYGYDDPSEFRFTAINQNGVEVTDGITVIRPDYMQKADGTYATALRDADIDPTTEDVGEHPLKIVNDNPNYDVVFTEESPKNLTITEFDISTDVAQEAVEDDPTTEENEAQDAVAEKFVITVDNVIYNTKTQFPDAEITFDHEVLGLMNLTYDVTKDPKEPFVAFVEKWGTVTDDTTDPVTKSDGYYETASYSYTKAFSPYTYPDGTVGSYTGDVKNVKRDAEGNVIEGANINVTGRGNFINVKKQPYAIQPAPLPIKVKDNAEMAYAGAKPVFELEQTPASEVYGAENATEQARILTQLAEAIAAYDPDGEYGFEGYDGATGSYTITVAEAAKTALNVIMAASNYTPEYAGGEVTVIPVPFYFAAVRQDVDYAEAVLADETYLLPDATSKTWTNFATNPVDLTPSTATVKVYSDAAHTAEITMTDEEIAQYVTLSCTTTKQGLSEGAIKIAPQTVVGVEIHTENGDGDLYVKPLEEIHLAYGNVSQALEDHKGYGGSDSEPMKVYLPKRNLNADIWYGMVLPFEVYVPELSTKIGYASVALLNKEDAGSDVHFDTKVSTIPANEPFLLKVAPANQTDYVENAYGYVTTSTAVNTASLYFDNVKIDADNIAKYNGTAAQDPYVQTAGGTKLIGSYKTIEYYDAAKYYIAKKTFAANEAFLSYVDGKFYKGVNSPNHKMLTTDAYLSFTSDFAAAGARIFIDDEDGTSTAIDAIGAEPVEAAPSKLAEGWYTVNGVKLNAKPTQKGAYIFNGKKVYVK